MLKLITKMKIIDLYRWSYIFKKQRTFLTKGASKAINEGIVINADNFKYDKIKNLINANGNVKIDNKDENYLIYTDEATYLKNKELLTKDKLKR